MEIFIQVIVFYALFSSAKCALDTFQFNAFGQCLKQNDKPNLVRCAGQQMLETFETFNSMENLTLTKGLTLSKDDSVMGRSNPINFLEHDPSDIRALLENAGLAVSQRSLQMDMSKIYPGLQMRIGPSSNGGLLEFIVDPHLVNDERSHLLHEESTARIMVRKFALPFLLGIKFNLAVLLPLILGAIILISKKAAFLSKLALFISGLFGIGGIYSLGGGLKEQHAYGQGYGYYPNVYGDAGAIHHQQQTFASPYKVFDINAPRDELPDDHFYDFDKQQLLKDRSAKLYEREIDIEKIQQQPKYRQTSQRNFVWQTTGPSIN